MNLPRTRQRIDEWAHWAFSGEADTGETIEAKLMRNQGPSIAGTGERDFVEDRVWQTEQAMSWLKRHAWEIYSAVSINAVSAHPLADRVDLWKRIARTEKKTIERPNRAGFVQAVDRGLHMVYTHIRNSNVSR